MPSATYLPPPPRVPVTQLPRAEIRSLAHVYGHHRRHATYRFCALLPLVARDRIYLDDGCVDVYEWAAKFGAMTRSEVDRILALWDDIGDYDCLWRLLAEGTGITKLERVAPHVTPDNATWLAEQVKCLTKPELEELLRGLRRSQAAVEQPAMSLAPPRESGRQPQERIQFVSDILPSLDPDPANPVGAAGRGAAAEPPADPDPRHPADGRGVTSTASSPSSEHENASLAEHAPADPAPLPDPAGPDGGAASSWFATRLSLELDAVGEKRIRELQTTYEQLYGRPIGIGQLVSLLARWAILRGELPSLEDLEAGLVPVDGRGLQTEAAAGSEASSAEAPLADPGRRPLPAGRTFQPRLLEVVVSIAETGWKFIRTAVGWVPATDGALAGFLTHGQPVPLGNLHVAAIAATLEVTGERYRPVAVERYLLARSGGYCEVGGCHRRVVAAHHRNRFAYDPSHHPDDLVCICAEHHGIAQAGRFRDESLDPAAWGMLEEGEEARPGDADRKFLECRARLTG